MYDIKKIVNEQILFQQQHNPVGRHKTSHTHCKGDGIDAKTILKHIYGQN